MTAFYGSVPQAVREIYFGYLGWFQADPVALRPTLPRDLSVKTVGMMGGVQKVVATAAESLANGRRLWAQGQTDKAHEALQWAAELKASGRMLRSRRSARTSCRSSTSTLHR